jgi:hypothetical protein
MAMISVPVFFEDMDGLPETAGRLDILGVVADMLADGLLRMKPVYVQYDGNEKRLMEIRLVPAHEEETPLRLSL